MIITYFSNVVYNNCNALLCRFNNNLIKYITKQMRISKIHIFKIDYPIQNSRSQSTYMHACARACVCV